MSIEIRTDEIVGTVEDQTIQEIADTLNSSKPMFSIGADYMCSKKDVISFYSGVPTEAATNTFQVITRGGDTYVISLPEGDNAETLTDKINKHSAGEIDQFGNRIVTKEFIVLGDEQSAVGLRFNDIRSAARVKRKTEESAKQ